MPRKRFLLLIPYHYLIHYILELLFVLAEVKIRRTRFAWSMRNIKIYKKYQCGGACTHLYTWTNQGVWNRREIQLTRPALPYTCFADGYSIWIINICLMYNYCVYNNLFWIFHIKMEYRLQIMYNHMVGRAESVISPFYFILLGTNLYILFKGRIQGPVQGGFEFFFISRGFRGVQH